MRVCGFLGFFFLKQKTAYEMRISDWSSDVCSSDLEGDRGSQSKGGDGDRNRQFEIVARGRERHRRRARIVALYQLAHEEADAELNHEVDEIGRASCRERVCQYV